MAHAISRDVPAQFLSHCMYLLYLISCTRHATSWYLVPYVQNSAVPYLNEPQTSPTPQTDQQAAMPEYTWRGMLLGCSLPPTAYPLQVQGTAYKVPWCCTIAGAASDCLGCRR